MNKKILISFVVVMCFYIGACSTYISKYDRLILETSEEDIGYIVGSYTVNCREWYEGKELLCYPYFPYMNTVFRGVDNKEVEGRVGINDFYESERKNEGVYHVDVDRNLIKRFFCKAVPKGDYEFYGVSTYSPVNYGAEYSLHKKNNFSSPFKVKQKTITYVGSFDHRAKKNRNNILFSHRYAFIADSFMIKDLSKSEIDEAVTMCPLNVRESDVVVDVYSMDKIFFNEEKKDEELKSKDNLFPI